MPNTYLPIHDVAIIDIKKSKTVVGSGYSVDISVTVENQGGFTETFPVEVYYDGNLIGTQEVTMPSLSSQTLTFTWDTADVPKGTYTIQVEAVLPIDEEPLRQLWKQW